MIDYRGDEYHRKRHPEFLDDADLRKAWSCFADLVYFHDVKGGETVFEFGGGFGANLLEVAKRAETHMLEPSQLARTIAARSGVSTVGTLDELAGRRFDWILCRHVLEHLEHPASTLCELKTRLKPNGILIVVVPCERPDAPPDPGDLNHHLYCWNPQSLSNLFEVCGLHVERWRYEYFGAKRKLMPVYRAVGGAAYARCVRAVGRIFRFRELVVEGSVPSPPGSV
jgi:SAM-dependent methyltransferase